MSINGFLKMNNIFWACKEIWNFGDYIGPTIYKYITGRDAEWGELSKPHYMVAGSILREANSNSIVMGAGYNGASQRFQEKPKEVGFVRGYNTRDQLLGQGIGSEVFGDPGLCLPRLYKKQAVIFYSFGVLPHYIDYNSVEVDDNILKINPTQHVLNVVDNITSCNFIISSSLHGLIVAHAYGVPAVWVEFSDRVVGNGYKFRDYYTLSMVRNKPKAINLRNESFITKEMIRERVNIDSEYALPDLRFANVDKMLKKFKEYWL